MKYKIVVDSCSDLTQEVKADEHFRVIPLTLQIGGKTFIDDDTFNLVVFDPPHLIHAGEKSWLRKKYGVLPENWKPYIKAGFDECMRVLKPGHTLIFKWNEQQIKTRDVLKTIDYKPLFGDQRSKTRWICFMK